MSTERDIAVVGMACVFPGAPDLATYWRNIVAGRDAVGEIPANRWPGNHSVDLPEGHPHRIPCRRGGFIHTPYLFDPLRHRVMPNAVKDGDADQFILLDILSEALADAGFGDDHPVRRRTDVIVGRGGYVSNKAMEIFMRADLLERMHGFFAERLSDLPESRRQALVDDLQGWLPEADPESLATGIPNLVASRASNRLNLRGTSYIVDAACASSLLSVEHGVRRLREGLCDAALACGINFTHFPPFWYLFGRLQALSPTGAIRPFDRNADGLLMGEGAGAVVLRRLEDAQKDGDHVYAVVKGVGSSSDGSETAILAPSASGQELALERAWLDGGRDPADGVGLLEAHGTGTVQGDRTETETLRRFFGPPRLAYPVCPMGSVKSMIGHTMPAAGIASFIKTVLALTHKLVPPSLHCDDPLPELEETRFYINTLARPWIQAPRTGPRRAAVNAFGFGGVNAHVLLEEARSGGPAATVSPGVHIRPPISAVERPTELLFFTGETPAEVAAEVRSLAQFLEGDRGLSRMEDVAFTLARRPRDPEPWRLAMVVEGAEGREAREELVRRLEEIAGGVEAGEKFDGRDGVSLGNGPPPGRVAGLFPGLAFPGLVGHYPDHLMTLCMHFPDFREAFDEVEERDRHPEDSLPTSFLLQPPAHLDAGVRARLRQRFAIAANGELVPEGPIRADERLLSGMGMLTSNWAGWRLVQSLGIPVEMLCGQSLGDISALCAADRVDWEVVIPRLWRYLSIDPRMPGAGCMAYAGLEEERLAPFLEGLPDVHLALHPAPSTLLLGGPDDQIEELVARLRKESVIAQKLPFPPIHTPRMADRQREFEALEGDPVPLRRARLVQYSTVTREPMPESEEELRTLISSNITKPVRFWQTLRRMYDDGARIFVQVGSGTLAGNIRTILPEEDVISVALDVDYRDPLSQTQHLCARLLAAGINMKVERLFEDRECVELDLTRPVVQAEARGLPLRLYWPPIPTEASEGAPAAAGHEVSGGRVLAGVDTSAAGASPEVKAEPDSPRKETPGNVLPFVGTVEEHVAGHRLVQTRRFRLDEDLYLEDHTFLARSEHAPLSHCFPVVPLTVTLEMLAQSSACLAPGLGLVAIADVRARRWLALDDVDFLDVRVEAERLDTPQEGDVHVRARALVDGEVAAEATLEFASSYRVQLDLAFAAVPDAGPLPVPVPELYSEGYFFHGPRFWALQEPATRGSHAVSAEMKVSGGAGLLASTATPQLLTDPVAIDAAGQMLGLLFFDRIPHMLPVAIDRIELYGPTPPPGTTLPLRMQLQEFSDTERRVRSAVEVQDGAGQVWFRISGWQDIFFRHSVPLARAKRQPTRNLASRLEALPGLPSGGVAAILDRSTMAEMEPDYIARLFLDPVEIEVYKSLGKEFRRRRDFLMGRIAAKDAARAWLARRDGATGGEYLHPLQLRIENDSTGRPRLTLDGTDPGPEISIAHHRQAAIAVACDASIGVDLERVDAGAALTLEDFATGAEIERLQSSGSAEDSTWLTRLWCGKEAAAKALGIGMGGMPKSFEAVELSPDGGLLVHHGEPPRRVRVQTSERDGTLFAVAALEDLPAVDPE